MNEIIEKISWSKNSYWGEPNKFKFKSGITTFTDASEFEDERIMGLKSENENILVKSYKIEHVKSMLKKKEIKNGLTLIALQWFFLEYYKD